MSMITPNRNTLRARINSPGEPLNGNHQAYIELILQADVGLCTAERERIRSVLARAFSEILEDDIRAIFDDELDIWPEKPVPWAMMREELFQYGFIASDPDPLDIAMVKKILCEKCEAGGQIPEGFRSQCYRVYAVCPECMAYQEI